MPVSWKYCACKRDIRSELEWIL